MSMLPFLFHENISSFSIAIRLTFSVHHIDQEALEQQREGGDVTREATTDCNSMCSSTFQGQMASVLELMHPFLSSCSLPS